MKRLVLCVALLACTNREAQRIAVDVGKPAPAYEAVTLAGDSASLAARRDRVVLLNVWATWCHPCRDEIPVLQDLHTRLSSRGLEVIGVSIDARGEEEEVARFVRQYGMTYPIWLDPDERVLTTFLAIGAPATYLIARDGTLLWRHIGPIKENDPRLMPILEKALTDPTT